MERIIWDLILYLVFIWLWFLWGSQRWTTLKKKLNALVDELLEQNKTLQVRSTQRMIELNKTKNEVEKIKSEKKELEDLIQEWKFKYVPQTERLKTAIVWAYKAWSPLKRIARLVNVDVSTISKALKRRRITR